MSVSSTLRFPPPALALASLLVLLLLLAGCGRVQNERLLGGPSEASSSILRVGALAAPATDRPAQLVVTLADGEPIQGATVEVEATMTHAGMEPVFVQAQEREPGSYLAEWGWTMGGEWLVKVRATLPDGTVVRQTVTGIQVETR